MDESRSIQIGHFGDKVEAFVEISSINGRMRAIPLLKIKENPKNTEQTAGESKEGAKKSLANILTGGNKSVESLRESGEISVSKGGKLIDQAREAIKKRKQEKADAEKTSALTGEIVPEEVKPPEEIHGSKDGAGSIGVPTTFAKTATSD